MHTILLLYIIFMKAGVNMKNKVMLVDDEPDILDLLEKSLNLEGFYSITKIENGLSAVDTCRKIQPDIIILDVMLTDIDG